MQRHVDLLDGTPILDIKPYIQSFDNIKNTKDGWYERGLDPLTVRSDKRFAQSVSIGSEEDYYSRLYLTRSRITKINEFRPQTLDPI